MLGLEGREKAWGNHPAVVGIGTTSGLFPVAGGQALFGQPRHCCILLSKRT
jgi:hypothetical protein